MIETAERKRHVKQQQKELLQDITSEEYMIKNRKYTMDKNDPGCQIGFLHAIKRRWIENHTG